MVFMCEKKKKSQSKREEYGCGKRGQLGMPVLQMELEVSSFLQSEAYYFNFGVKGSLNLLKNSICSFFGTKRQDHVSKLNAKIQFQYFS